MTDSSHTISNNEEEETIAFSSFDEDENDIGSSRGGDEGVASSLLSQENLDDNGHEYDNDATPTITVRKPPSSAPSTSSSSSQPGRRHPPPSLPNSPIASRLKDHFETQNSDWSPSIAADPTNGDDFEQQQQQQQEQETNNSHNHNSNEQQRPKSISAASLVVCGVDGTVYTLDAYTGQLRGMFASGPALVYSSSPDEDSADDDAADFSQASSPFDDEESNAIANTSPRWKERIVPGLDGRLYNLFQMDDGIDDDDDSNDYSNDSGECDDDGICEEESNNIMPHLGSYNLSPLPISVMDVVDSPISTCRPRDDPSQPKQCGIVVGSKKTTVYAIDPTTGKVQWTQDPLGRGGGRGFTTHPPPNKSARGLTVLLQREDYAVRHLNTEGGGEVWKVELGRFSALDFDVDAHDRGGNRGSEEEDEMDEREEDRVVGGSRRGTAAAAAANLNRKDQKTSPILGGTRKHGALHEHKEHHHGSKMFDEDDFDDHSHFRGFPSVAFGEDGTTLMAADGISGELLWKVKVESVVAAVYGVGKESTWVPLEVIDESDVFTHGHSSQVSRQGSGLLGISPSPASLPASNSGGLIPYGESDQSHRLGRYQTSIFVSSKFDPLGLDSSFFAEDEYEELPIDAELPLQPQTNVHPNGFSPAESSVFPGKPPDIMLDQSYSSEHGLYLTWSIVYGIIALLIAFIVFVRTKYVRQKRKWLNTPSLDPTRAPSGSDDGNGRDRFHSDGMLLPPAAQRVNGMDRMWRSKDRQPVMRSLSLGAMASPSGSYESKHFISVAGQHDDNISSPILNKKTDEKSMATTATPTTIAEIPAIGHSNTLPLESSSDKAQLQQPDNIDGIPLVRYPRYQSEFDQKSPLGRGGFGTVFQCENTLDGSQYAIKKIRIKSQLDLDGKVTKHFSQKLHRVLREVKILALLDHPNIVRYYTAWLEVDDGSKNDDEETNVTLSTLDRKTSGFFSGSLFGFGSTSKHAYQAYSPKRPIQQRSTAGLFGSYVTKSNPLGWNNFGSFRLDESKSGIDISEQNSDTSREDDIGFTWERSNDATAEQSFAGVKRSPSELITEVVDEEENESESDSGLSSVDDEEESSNDDSSSSESDCDTVSKAKKEVKLVEPEKGESAVKIDGAAAEGRYILYIQMQLCSAQTLDDFLKNREKRVGSISPSLSQANEYVIDIPLALRLFKQISHGVKYVHKQGLIHRDLKPQNCFIDEAGNVKVGDFGLSRENSNAPGAISDDNSVQDEEDDVAEPVNMVDAENTAGVGTRAYASPEQMRGSKYDASTDIYSLGIILFELCYPMYTSMERCERFGDIRKRKFPAYWISSVKNSFPKMHELLVCMLSESASERPSADEVFDQIDSLLSEYSVQSLDKAWGKKEGVILLRVEADDHPDILSRCNSIIKDAAPSAKILQYGLRGQASKAIIEFALEAPNAEEDIAEKIKSALGEKNMSVRQIFAT
eukprot:CAMPEP_0113376890 /NCGR_PEP_ID=MMETSP0013_2-20120614/2867_1 /TAXON_ID=2843 ORGANISM="Skeletonema costatum, Strain 1716" /NCGR_SAMPLE_ID=MMETSP0013_2 /ASSEMBLY_ACC=CAM_ASM_000158 /LENGTH=1455 /DNA_ID=CAMNT_0000258995 /DNA_START=108 /DNA_END=4475 /DNA_ORIENTATION=+ /assembly_acc=CAM_ASM_000158